MEAVKGKLCVWKIGLHTADKRRRQIDTHLADLLRRGLFFFQIVFNRGYRSRSFPLRDMNHTPLVHIYGDGKVAVAFAATCLIDAQLFCLAVVCLGIRLVNLMVKDRPNAARILSLGFPYPVDWHLVFNEHHGVGLKQYRKSTAFANPGDIYLFDGAVGPPHTRNLTRDVTGMLKKV